MKERLCNGFKQVREVLKKFWTSREFSVRFLRLALIICIVFLFTVCPLLNWLNTSSLWIVKWIRAGESINDSVSNWLGFWASFSGTLATLILGAVTLRLTEKIQEQDDKELRLEKQLSVAREMPKICCSGIRIYSLDRKDYQDKYLTLFERKNKYCIRVELENSFPAYFDINITGIGIELPGRERKSVWAELDKEMYIFTNHKNFVMYINVPEKLYDILGHVYLLNLEATNVTPFSHKQVIMNILFECNNIFLDEVDEIEGKVNFELRITMENVGKDIEGHGVQMDVHNLQFVRPQKQIEKAEEK